MMTIKQLFAVICLSILFSGASSAFAQGVQTGDGNADYPKSAAQYLHMAQRSQAPERQAYMIQAAGRLSQERNFTEAQRILSSINDSGLPANIVADKYLLLANLGLVQGYADYTLEQLRNMPEGQHMSAEQQTRYYRLKAQASQQLGNPLESAKARMGMAPLLKSKSAIIQNDQKIWNDLYQLPAQALAEQAHNTSYGTLQGWLDIVFIDKQYANQPTLLAHERQRWQQHYPQHPANDILPKAQKKKATNWLKPFRVGTTDKYDSYKAPSELKVALLLPVSGKLAKSGQAIKNGYMAAYYDKQSDGPNITSIEVYDTAGKNVVDVYKKAIKQGANLVVGPLTKENVAALEKSRRISVPTLTLNYTARGAKGVRNTYEFALSPQDEARQVALKAKHDGISHAMVIAPGNAWGQGIADSFASTWQAMGGTVVNQLNYSTKTDMDKAIKDNLEVSKSNQRTQNLKRLFGEKVVSKPQRRQDIDVIFLIASPTKARQVVPLLKFYYAADLPIYATSQVYSGKNNPGKNKDLDGVKFCDAPWVLDEDQTIQVAKQQMGDLMPNPSPQNSKLYAFGLDAFKLSMQLNPPTLSNYTGIDGMTGKLYLDNQQIFRQLQWAEFVQGTPQVLQDELG